MEVVPFAQQWLAEWRTAKWSVATDRLRDAIRDDPEVAWSLIGQLVATASDDEDLDMIGAGPLEDLLCDHGPLFIDRVEKLAVSDRGFRRSLADVWGWNRMDEQVRSRLDDALRRAFALKNWRCPACDRPFTLGLSAGSCRECGTELK